jgi:hypothetical protein
MQSHIHPPYLSKTQGTNKILIDGPEFINQDIKIITSKDNALGSWNKNISMDGMQDNFRRSIFRYTQNKFNENDDEEF